MRSIYLTLQGKSSEVSKIYKEFNQAFGHLKFKSDFFSSENYLVNAKGVYSKDLIGIPMHGRIDYFQGEDYSIYLKLNVFFEQDFKKTLGSKLEITVSGKDHERVFDISSGIKDLEPKFETIFEDDNDSV